MTQEPPSPPSPGAESSIADTSGGGAPPVGYSLILPPGWKKIPLRRKRRREEAVREIVEGACRQLPSSFPRDSKTRYRLEVERRLQTGIKNARKSGGIDFYLPVAPSGDTPIAASFVVGEVHMEGDPVKLLASMAARDGHEPTEVADAPGTRHETVREADADEDTELASRRVDYVVAVPGDPGRWLTVSFSTMGAGDPSDELAHATVSLFDAIMTTFRWSAE